MALERKTLLETKNRALKCLKRHYSTVQSMKNVAVLTEDGVFATPGNMLSKAQKNVNARGQPGWGEGRGGGLSTAGIDRCIKLPNVFNHCALQDP